MGSFGRRVGRERGQKLLLLCPQDEYRGMRMGKKKILLIDDEADFVTLVRVRLEANNYEVCVAFDGVEGLEKAEKEKPDLIILDIGMPNRVPPGYPYHCAYR
jgi:PleD family two-component response regulator